MTYCHQHLMSPKKNNKRKRSNDDEDDEDYEIDENVYKI